LDSAQPTKRIAPADIRSRKGGMPIVALTAYTTPIALRLDPYVDLLLVGDSLAMVIYGMDTTVGVTLETMIAHGQAVMRGAKRACVVIDLPSGSYEESPAKAVATAGRVLKETGAAAVKLEGGIERAESIRRCVAAGIPVLSHIGLLPQSVTEAGGFKVQGRDEESARRILEDAKAVAEAGAFTVVVESTVEPLARRVTETIPIPTIGIGASPACDGQILVTDDVIGLFTAFTPKFVKRYADVGQHIGQAARAYAEDVRARRFPGPEHCFGVKPKKV
jgi:3-methyl-2-oxobutanoate hydroxymethyltransferase